MITRLIFFHIIPFFNLIVLTISNTEMYLLGHFGAFFDILKVKN